MDMGYQFQRLDYGVAIMSCITFDGEIISTAFTSLLLTIGKGISILTIAMVIFIVFVLPFINKCNADRFKKDDEK